VDVLLADDHGVVCQGLRTLFESECGIDVIGVAADGLEALEKVGQLKPEIMVLDLMMPGLGGIDVLRQAKRLSPNTKIVVYSMYSSGSYVAEALKNGAGGYVLKNAAPDHLVKALREVAAGRRYLSPPLSEESIGKYLEIADSGEQDVYDTLTPREREVMHLVLEGRNNTDIGQRLTISLRTVEYHRSNVMKKLGLRTKAELMRFALKKGILPVE
jgi:two-component system response regulator NreC